MAGLRDFGTDCFLCRVMRSFAITGLGAGATAAVARHLGAPREEAADWAFAVDSSSLASSRAAAGDARLRRARGSDQVNSLKSGELFRAFLVCPPASNHPHPGKSRRFDPPCG